MPEADAAHFAPVTRVLALIRQHATSAAPNETDRTEFALVDPDSAWLSVFDQGITRGDGIFETIAVRFGETSTLDAHLDRFAHSARALDLPEPDLDVWAAAVGTVAAELRDFPEGSIKAVLTRGVEGTDQSTGWISGAPAPDFGALRREGVRVVTLDRGYRHDAAVTAPWLLLGAKTLSYGVNAAAVREAKRRGAQDAIFVSSDGFVLDGATSSVMLRHGPRLITPGGTTSILVGTTQGRLLTLAPSHGLRPAVEPVTLDTLRGADAAWLVSSVRGAIPITGIDGAECSVDVALSAAMNELLRH